MSKENSEHRAYRKSPGRQYGYEYNPLRNQYQVGQSQNGTDSAAGAEQATPRLAQRPDPRRTRQLLRQSILASRLKTSGEIEDQVQDTDTSDYAYARGSQPSRGGERTPRVTRRFSTAEEEEYLDEYEGRTDNPSNRGRYRSPREDYAPDDERGYVERRHVPEDDWPEFDFVDPDIGYEDPLDQRMGYAESPLARRAPETTRRSLRPVRPEPDYDEEEYEEEEEEAPRRKPKKRGKIRRRALLGLGIGAIAVGGIAAYELVPKIPGALSEAGTNIEHELQDAFNKGVAQGAEEARKEFITALDSIEGVSLQAAIDSARLTRLAYDAFVSPIVTLAATITGDFLNITLRALIAGRGWLARINQDNDTLAALQTVLQTWVQKVNEVPEQLQSITDSDLDGAQSYLRGLQRTIQEEQAKLNGQATPTPAPTRGTHSTPTP